MSGGPVDAVVIGAGPNGLVAANILADAGWRVCVLEAEPEPGGAVRSDSWPREGFVRDLCAAFFPFTAASPAIRALRLEEHGLRWAHAPIALANPLPSGRAALLHRDPARTAAELDRLAPGDGAAWLRLHETWQLAGPALLEAICTPFPPLRAGAALLRSLGAARALRLARTLLLPVRRLVEEEFRGPAPAMLLAGCALHTDLTPDSAGGSAVGWLLAMLAHQVGWPVPRGGAGELAGAMVRRLRAKGGEVVCDAPVREIVVRAGRAVAVRTDDGDELPARRAVLADVAATQLYGELVAWEHLPGRLAQDIRRFDWDQATFKVDWALSGPVPWAAPDVAAAGTVHVGESLTQLTEDSAQLATGVIPQRPFLLLGQTGTADPSRAPQGAQALWAYTHLPRRVRADAGGGLTGRWDERECEAFADRITARIEQFAPGFAGRVLDRLVTSPEGLASHDRNLVGGAINGGTAGLHQALLFRPVPGLGRPETPVAGLYLASASAHPGGGVHGAPGANAARAALIGHRLRTQRFTARVARSLVGDQAG